ncbi:hypothetical protein [uncultured Desulfobacter sp.]|uniref:hypothetical protein n=1 Tax=uncultured Desulfobacter sp. TaxID=240139 RepID=UPI0029F531CB|nr:hypothetical protein [uncultured Desulfobacter sp.]
MEPETPIQETQTEIPGPIPKRGTPEYSDWLFNKIDPMKRSGMSSIKIERQFNAEGTKPASTKKNKFNRGMADSFYKGKLEKMGLRWDKDLKKPVPIE